MELEIGSLALTMLAAHLAESRIDPVVKCRSSSSLDSHRNRTTLDPFVVSVAVIRTE